MALSEPFTFGIPLIARASARDWARVEALLDLTLASLAGQTQRDFQVVIAGHDRPALPADAPALTFLQADWPAEPVRSDNRDSGRKKHAINAHVLARGGGLLMFVDADDWIDRRLVAAARAAIGPEAIGGLVEAGFALDWQSLRAAPIPDPAVFDGGFHRLCGSSTVARLTPGHPDPLRRDPHAVLHEHYRWIEVAREHHLALAHLDVDGAYVINTAENHSELHGPFAEWRRTFTRGVAREGRPVDDAFLARFGLSVARLRAARERGHRLIV